MPSFWAPTLSFLKEKFDSELTGLLVLVLVLSQTRSHSVA